MLAGKAYRIMAPALLSGVSPAALAAFCERWQVQELAVFGSVARGEAGPESDVDLLVTFAVTAKPSLLTLAAMEIELEDLLGRPVDLVERRGVEQSANWLLRRAILSTARPLEVS